MAVTANDKAKIKYIRKHIVSGLCRSCPNKVVPGRRHCQVHLDKIKERIAGLRKKWKKEGRCIRCGRELRRDVTGNNAKCQNCSEWRTAR